MKKRSQKSRRQHSCVYLFTGEGKGKTSAALGTAVRALGNGWRVVWIAFYKEASWGMSEYELPQLLLPEHQSRLQMYLLGKGFYIQAPEKVVDTPRSNGDVQKVKLASLSSGGKVIDDDTPDVHKQAANAALSKALEVLRGSKPPEVLVLDEVCNAIADGLIQESALLELLALRNSTHIILTGRFASESLQAHCDLVSEILNKKHPYDSGQLAIKGLDY